MASRRWLARTGKPLAAARDGRRSKAEASGISGFFGVKADGRSVVVVLRGRVDARFAPRVQGPPGPLPGFVRRLRPLSREGLGSGRARTSSKEHPRAHRGVSRRDPGEARLPAPNLGRGEVLAAGVSSGGEAAARARAGQARERWLVVVARFRARRSDGARSRRRGRGFDPAPPRRLCGDPGR